MKTAPAKRKIIFPVRIAILLSSQIGIASALNVSINGSGGLLLASNIVYDYQSSPSTISFTIDSPIVCTSITPSSPVGLILDINDNNNLVLSTMDNNVSAFVYDLPTGTVNIQTDDSIQCATQSDITQLPNAFFSDGFEEFTNVVTNDLEINLYDGNGDPFLMNVTYNDQDIVEYQYVVTNNGSIPLSANLGEYFKLDNAEPYFSGVTGADWGCVTANTGAGSTSSCGGFVAGNNFVRLSNAIIDPGEMLVISVSRTIEIPITATKNEIDLLGAGFVINNQDSLFSNNVIFHQFNL